MVPAARGEFVRLVTSAKSLRRFVGRLAKIVTNAPVSGQSAFAGRLSGVEGESVLVTEGRRIHRIPLTAIKRARLEVEF